MQRNQRQRAQSSQKMKNKQRQAPIEQVPSTDENYSEQSEQYADMNSIAINIIEIVNKELNSIDSQSLLTDLMQLLKNFQGEIISQVDESQYQNSEFEEMITKNLENIMNYFIKCLQIFDNVKSNSIENLKACLTDLFQIISNELEHKENTKQNNNNITSSQNPPVNKQSAFTMDTILTKEQSFVDLINILSGSIKDYSKNLRSVSKKIEANAETAVNGLEQCKESLNDLVYQMNSITYKNSLQIKKKAKLTCKISESLEEINKEIQKQSKIVVGYNTTFFENAKEVFKKLKSLHSEKMQDIKLLCDEFSSSQKTFNNTMSYNNRVNPNTKNSFDKISVSQSNAPNKNIRKNQSVSPTRKRIVTTSTYVKENERNYNKDLAHSTDLSAQKKKGKRPLNISTTNYESSNISNISTVNKKDSMLTDLSEQNKELKIELNKISDENQKLKQSLSNLQLSYEKALSNNKETEKKMPKSKSLRNFLSKNISNENDNNKALCNQCFLLAQSILSFIKAMKDLQTSIVKKVANVSEMKKDFEMQKNDIQQLALSVTEGKINTDSIQSAGAIKKEKVDSNTMKMNASLQKEYERMIKTCKDYESVIKNLGEQINEKNQEIVKLNSDISKMGENKKVFPNQAKLKEFENKIMAYKTENEQLKKNIEEYEGKIKELKEEIVNKDKILSLPKVDMKYNESLKEIEKLNNLIEDTKKLNVKYKKQIDEMNNSKKTDEIEMKKLRDEKEEMDLKNKTILEELSSKAQEVTELQNKKSEIENEMKNLIKQNEQLKNDYDTLNAKSTNEIQNSLANSQTEVSNLKKQNDKLNLQLQSLMKELSTFKENDKNKQTDFKNKLTLKDNEIAELKKSIASLQAPKAEPIKNISFTAELSELSNMIKNIHTTLNSKHKEARINISSQELRRNPNDGFLIYEQDEKEEEVDSILSNVHNSIDGNNLNESISKVNAAMDKNRNYYTEITQMINILFGLFDKKVSKKEDKKKLNEKQDIHLNQIINSSKREKDDKSDEIKKLTEENQFLKNFFTECTTTIFESIKEQAPHMVEEESDISFNIVSGPNSPINLLDSKNTASPGQGKSKSGIVSFDPEVISNAVSRFKAYNQEINEQLKKLAEEKEELEKEAHKNLVTANAYKVALDDAISKMNSHMANEENEMNTNKNSPNNGTNLNNIQEARAFTVEDLENPLSETSGIKSGNSHNIKGQAELKKINNDLIKIQNDLLKKINAKDEELEKNQETINNLLTINNSSTNINSSNIKDKMVISAEKYHQLLQLYTNEQDKNHELRASYYSFINEFSEFVQNGKSDKNKSKSKPNSLERKEELTLGNEENSKDNNYNNEEEVSVEDYNQSLDNDMNKANMLIENQEGKKNRTHGQIKSKQKDYLGMLNEKDLLSNHSAAGGMNEIQLNEILLEKKSLEEQEELLMTQLTALKTELKETREQVKALIVENTKLKEDLADGGSLKRDDIIGTLRNALDRLIPEIQITAKVKEFLTVILRVVGYSDEQIMTIYQSKEKKKGFFNRFGK